MKSLIQKLVESVGPSGYEDAVRELVRLEIEPFADEISVDALGNLVAHKGKKEPNGLRVMLSAHLDEIGVMVTHVDENGFVRFTNIGGVRPLYCMGARVRFVNGAQGTINSERLQNAERVPALEKMFIDVGATSSKDCPVQVGDAAVFDRPFLDLGNRLIAKAMDDRISVAVQIETMRRLVRSPHELYFVFSVQEELGLRGATTAAYDANPDLGISIDVTFTGDTPKGLKMVVALGKGPAIKVRDGRMLSDPKIVRWMVDACQRARLPYQLEVLEAGTTDAAAIQLTRAGVPSGCISIPCRYVHSPSETVDFRDVENAVELLVQLLSKPIILK